MSRERKGKMGAGGYCVCLKCGYRKLHEAGVPCMEQKCPQCGKALMREGSEHYKLAVEKKKKQDG